jgi:phytoene dehydrogenase-like protein
MNVALAELPDFTCLPGRSAGDHHTAGIIIAPTLKYMERAYFDAREHGWSRAPIVELVIPSTLDDSLAPAGQHVASLFCQHVAPILPDGQSWDQHRESVADLMIDTVNQYAPNFKASVLGRQIMSPLDLERTFGLVNGDIMHGVLSLDQLFSARPMLGYGNYRGPLGGLYMCGAGTHPRAGEAALRASAPRAAPPGPHHRHHRVPEALRPRWPLDPHHQYPGRSVGGAHQPPLPQQG